jgi:hypothetical protein
MSEYPVTVQGAPATEGRNRLTVFFRLLLAIPHLILVGGMTAGGFALHAGSEGGLGLGGSGGLLGLVVVLTSVALWFIIVFSGRDEESLYRFAAWYLRWRIRATAYLMLLRDEYPPFGDDGGEYPIELHLGDAPTERDRVTVFFRLLLAIPHLILITLVGLAWGVTTFVAWVFIVLTGRYPEMLYGFALGALAWTARVEAYLLLLRDEYPPFSLRV